MHTEPIAHTAEDEVDFDSDDDDDLQVLAPAPITLEDHTVSPGETTPGLWARSARVVDYAIVSGSRTRAGAYVAWNCLIETFEVCHWPSSLLHS
jgi:hypothetical protein